MSIALKLGCTVSLMMTVSVYAMLSTVEVAPRVATPVLPPYQPSATRSSTASSPESLSPASPWTAASPALRQMAASQMPHTSVRIQPAWQSDTTGPDFNARPLVTAARPAASGAARSSVIRTVAIPPIPLTLANAMPAILPVVVTPSIAGQQPSKPLLIRPVRMPAGPLPGILSLPVGDGPFPAVILLHGCNGPFLAVPDWAYRLNGWGYAVLMPDSMTPRGVKTVCEPGEQPKVTAWDRVGDVAAAAAWLRTQVEIDPVRIAVLGLSHGGAAAALSVQTPYAAMGLRGAIDYYGPCIEPRLHGSVPLLVLAGEADDWGDPARRCRAYGQQLRPDQPFEIHTYPNVYHAFDSGPRTKTFISGHAMAFDQAAAEDSFVRVRIFLDRQVRN